MGRKRLDKNNIRKLSKTGGTTYYATIPIGIIRELEWQENQKLVVKKKGKKIIIEDWRG